MESKYINFLVRITIFFILVLFTMLLFGCRTIKSHETTITKDSVNINSKVGIITNSVSFMRLDEPCDGDGNLRPLFYEKLIGGLNTTVQNDNGSLLIGQEQKADTVFEKETIYKDKLIYKDKKVDVPFIPGWIKKLLGGSLFLNLIAGLWIFKKPLLRMIKLI